MPPARAAAFLRGKGLRLTGPYWELDGPEHARVFTVAQLAKLDVLADIKAAVQQALDEGRTERWFSGELVDVLRRKGWWGPAVQVDPDTGEARIIQQGSLRRLQTIYRTNLQSAYMAGRHQQALEQADRAPYVQYLAVRDAKTRPGHAALHGKVFRLQSEAWSIIAPPNGYNCRCRFRTLSQRELERRGLKVEEDIRLIERTPQRVPTDPLTGESPARVIERGVSIPDPASPGERLTLWADRGWDHLPGSDGAERALVDRVMARATELGDGIREVVVPAVARRMGVASSSNGATLTAERGGTPQAPATGANPMSGTSTIYSDERRTLTTTGTRLTVTSKAGTARIELDRAEVIPVPANINAAIKQQGMDPAGWYGLKQGSAETYFPPQTRAAVDGAMARAKALAEAQRAEASSPAAVARREVSALDRRAESMRDNPGAYFPARVRADAARAKWESDYPQVAAAERRERLLMEAADLERKASDALSFDADGSLAVAMRKERHDRLMDEARALREQAGAL